MTRERRYTPSYDATWEEYLRVLDAHGVGRALLVQPSFLGTDNSYLLDAIEARPERFRGVVVLDTADPRAATRVLPSLHGRGVRGIRLNLLGAPPPAIDRPEWRVLGERMAELGWHLEVQATGEQWARLSGALRTWPAVVVIDHVGLPQSRSVPQWTMLVSLAALPHVWVKISGLYRSPAGFAGARELCARVGTSRLVWGSDWPWTRFEDGRDYRALLDELHAVVADDADRICGENATKLLGWSSIR